MATANKKKERKSCFKPDFEYEVDYNDHFETPIEAYTDILPILDSLLVKGERQQHKRKEHIIYDPYYCDGRTKTILRTLGFDKVVHEKRDFYKDIQGGNIPNHHTLVTNPPYSDDHKEKCLEFCVKQFREQNIAFFLLIPNYVAARSYYRRILGDTIHDVAYLVPYSEYSYSHPEGTGHEESPFASLWFCGIGKERIQELKKNWNNNEHDNDNTKTPIGKRPKFVASFDELVSLGAISLQNRPNPRQRKKMRKMAAQSIDLHRGASTSTTTIEMKSSTERPSSTTTTVNNNSKEKIKGKKRNTSSKYRSNKTGKREKKRF